MVCSHSGSTHTLGEVVSTGSISLQPSGLFQEAELHQLPLALEELLHSPLVARLYGRGWAWGGGGGHLGSTSRQC